MPLFRIKFWGVRGTLPVPGQATLRYGGNTSCVEVQCAGRTVILDAGTGLYPLGLAMRAKEADILLSHTHIDHLVGLLFFPPAYEAGRRLRVWAGHLLPEHRLEEVIDRLMSPPIFPLTRNDFKASMEYKDFHAGSPLEPGCWAADGITVDTLPLNHPDRATGYRVTHAGRSLCYITDIEHAQETPDAALVRFLRGADALIYDSTYTDEEFARHRGWGHSTWQQGVRLAEAAGVKKLLLFHHDPAADDATLAARQEAVTRRFPEALLTQEGMEISL